MDKEKKELYISCINKMLDINFEVLNRLGAELELKKENESSIIENTRISIKRYEDLKHRIINNEEMKKLDYNLLAIAIQGNITSLKMIIENYETTVKELEKEKSNILNAALKIN